MGDRGKNNLEHKVGIKLLDRMSLENVFPMYENLFQKIEECRSAARSNAERDKQKDPAERHYRYQYNLMYDNVFSILGMRGTGKTSVAYTLRRRIKLNAKHTGDVVLPIIIPEIIPENCGVLGWILAIIKEEIEQLEGQDDTSGKNMSAGLWDDCAYTDEADEHLTKRLEIMQARLFAGEYVPSKEKSYYETIHNMSAASESNYQFAKGMADLWDALVDRLKKTSKSSCPLIFFIFDDVDLTPDRVWELLSVIMKYLAHPNLIVITTADEKLLLDVIERRLDKNIGFLPKEWHSYLTGRAIDYDPWESREDRNHFEPVSEIAKMYLGKVMPPSTRYYLQLFKKASQKAGFWLNDKETLGEGICSRVKELIKYIEGEKSGGQCFMEAGGKLVYFYLSFFGSTSRQISNVYIGIQELTDSLIRLIGNRDADKGADERFLHQIYKNFRYFFSMAIHSNYMMSTIVESDETMDINGFIDMLFLQQYHGRRLYINYQCLNDFLFRLSQDDERQIVEVGLQYYSLLVFAENLLLILEGCADKGITGRRHVNAVWHLTQFLNQYVFENRYVFREDLMPDDFFSQYYPLLERIPEMIEDKNSDGSNLDAEYFYNVNVYSYNEKESLYSIYRKNRRWFLEITRMLVRMYGNMYLITGELLEECIPFSGTLNRLGYQVHIYNFLKNSIMEDIQAIDLYEYAVKTLKETIETARSVWRSAYREEEYKDYIFKLKEDLIESMNENTDENVDENTDENEPRATFISFAEFLSYVEGREKNQYRYYPKEIIDDLNSLRIDISNTQKIQELIGKYILYAEQQEELAGYMCISDVPSWLQRFQEVRRSGIFSIEEELTRVDRILGPILNKESYMDKEVLQLVFGTEEGVYDLLRELFDRILEKLNMKTDDADVSRTREMVKSLVAGMDVVLNLDDADMYLRAMDTAKYMLFLSYLTQHYICLKIKENYGSDRLLSSRELRRTAGRRKTYYYHLFEEMKKLLEEKQTKTHLIGLERLIADITGQQRRLYVERLLEEG